MPLPPSVLNKIAGLIANTCPSIGEHNQALSNLQQLLLQRRLVAHSSSDLLALGRNQLQYLLLTLYGLAEATPTTITAGMITSIIEQLEQKLPLAVEQAAARQMIGTHLPLLPVINPAILDLPLQARLMKNDVERVGSCDFAHSMFLLPDNCQSATLTPAGCYWLIDVEDGTDTCTESPGKLRGLEHSSGRSLLLMAEVIALATQTDVLQRHNLSVAGSYFDDDYTDIPLLINKPTGPSFDTHDPFDSAETTGIPSCLYRI